MRLKRSVWSGATHSDGLKRSDVFEAGCGSEDNPVVEDMHQAASAVRFGTVGSPLAAMDESWTVRQVMSAPVRTVSRDCGVKEVVALLSKYGISRMPVVDGDDRLLGVV